MRLLEKKEIIDIIKEKAEMHQIDWRLLYAIMMVESTGNQLLMKYEPCFESKYLAKLNLDKSESFLRACSYGLMQVMGQTAIELGWNEPLWELLDAEKNIEYACKLLKSLYDKYKDEVFVIAAYNGGLRKKNSDFVITNEDYVSKVLSWKNKLK